MDEVTWEAYVFFGMLIWDDGDWCFSELVAASILLLNHWSLWFVGFKHRCCFHFCTQRHERQINLLIWLFRCSIIITQIERDMVVGPFGAGASRSHRWGDPLPLTRILLSLRVRVLCCLFSLRFEIGLVLFLRLGLGFVEPNPFYFFLWILSCSIRDWFPFLWFFRSEFGSIPNLNPLTRSANWYHC